MCLAVYIAHSSPLPSKSWNEKSPGIFIKELNANDRAIKDKFSLDYVYYLGSDEGCGCGFAYTERMAPAEDKARRAQNYRDLAKYLTENNIRGQLEFFACWEGDQEKGQVSVEQIEKVNLETPNIEFSEQKKFQLNL
jgi:hypothetical protein